ncbi:MAG: hypothetical protein HDR11_06910 [Lachnospiraceae bacterium]|nr:hypothetical protein [Lachnospiraceae bacterium]
MTDYESWVQQMINSVAVEEKHEKIYKQYTIDEAIAHITKENVSDTHIRNAYRMSQADVERNYFK